MASGKFPASLSNLTVSSHRSSLCGHFFRAISSSERAFVTELNFFSSRAYRSQSGTEKGQRNNPVLRVSQKCGANLYVFRASSILFCASYNCPSIICSFAASLNF